MAEVAGLTAALANSNVPTMGVFCWAHRMEGSAMLEVLTDGDNALRMTTAEENFETWEACVAARDNIADLYRTRYKHQVIAALCHRDPSTKTIKVKLLEKPRT